MIRLTFVLRKKPRMSMEKFQKYWREKHGPLVAKHATTLDIQRYVQVHTLDDPLNEALPTGRGKMLPIYDGVEELWWQNEEDLLTAFNSSEGQAAANELLEDEKNFIDLPNSPLWFAYEYPQVNPSPENLVARENSSILKEYYPLRHLSSLSFDEAQLYWLTTHGPKVRMIAQQTRILRYIQVHRYENELANVLREARGTKEEAFTGHAELWWDRPKLMSIFDTPEGLKAFGICLEDEKNFIDFSRSSIWMAKEHVFIDRR
jgi:uncharacterized protein (TIGR02118 family)